MESSVKKTCCKEMTKEELQRISALAVKGFCNAHPDVLDKNYIQSIAKRVAGQLYTHFVHNPKQMEEDNEGK